MTYPIILRKKVLQSLEQGMSVRTAAKLYDMSPTTIINWKKRHQYQAHRQSTAQNIYRSTKTRHY